jgi:hypothetical protein
MKNEINKDFYCSTAGMKDCPSFRDCLEGGIICPDCHRKHPTPEQYKEEYDIEYPEDGAVWYRRQNDFDGYFDDWLLDDFETAVAKTDYELGIDQIVCACTPFGKPDDNWRPE